MISVALASYNGEQYLEKQLRSLVDQTLPPDEIVICDDCSTDHTVDIIQSFAREFPAIRLIRNRENQGYRRNFRKAIKETKGDLIFLSDQDDEWHPDKVRQMSRLMEEKGCTVLCCDYALIGPESEKLPKEQYDMHPIVRKTPPGSFAEITFHTLVFGNVLQGCTYCFRKDVKEQYLRLHNDMVDHDHQIVFAGSLMGTVLFYKKELIDYRIHQGNALGLSLQSQEHKLELHKPSPKPFMVTFLEELDQVLPVRHKWFYALLYYLRIPYLLSRG